MLDEALKNQLIRAGRDFMKGVSQSDPALEAFESDQDLCKPQPPLVKARMRPDQPPIPLPRDFSFLPALPVQALFGARRSQRVYTDQYLTLPQLSWLLWSTQGVKGLRGKAYATLRTVPCGGARHEFETYLALRKVEGLEPGVYHYLPMEHALERLEPRMDDAQFSEEISGMLCGQTWAAKASVVFFWSMVAYRAEWRYGIFAHRVALIDVGHVGENLYLACTAAGLGTCGIGAFDQATCCSALGLDGEEEYAVYAQPVGTVRGSDQPREQAFYSFVEEQGL